MADLGVVPRRERWLYNVLFGVLTGLLGTYLGARFVVDGVFEIKLTGIFCVMVTSWALIIWLRRRSK
jgi:hypothetical protein